MCDCEPTTIEQAKVAAPAEQIQELSAEVARLRQQLSSAQPTLDVDRLVEAIDEGAERFASVHVTDEELFNVYNDTYMANAEVGRRSARTAAIRALVLTALGMEVPSGEQEAPAAAPAG